MDRNDYFFPVAVMDGDTPTALAGTAFLAAPGVMMSCRHVVDRPVDLAVHDLQTDEFLPVAEPTFDPGERRLDLAVFESPLTRDTPPIAFTLSETVRMGSVAWAAGYFRTSPIAYEIEPAFLSGRVSSVLTAMQTHHGAAELVLPFPVIEGFSGTPLMIELGERAGLAGVCHGSRQQRAVAEEVIEVRAGDQKRSEITYRVVEFGLAFHVNAVAEFLPWARTSHLRASDAISCLGVAGSAPPRAPEQPLPSRTRRCFGRLRESARAPGTRDLARTVAGMS